MNDTIKKYLLQSTMIAGLATAGFAMPAHAQVADEDLAVDVISEEEADEGQGDQIVVTGSRLKRDAFTSTAPIQVITSEDAAEQGLFSAVDILQTNAAASGQQIDSTFQGFVLDNGPGSETINLRALGADRTLVLLNGRRIGPSGAEGSPTQPSVNLIPNTMVDRIDLLLDGASAVYGSDAIGGVANFILRDDFEGVELSRAG
jgi:iron complex outermembrane receptor protein